MTIFVEPEHYVLDIDALCVAAVRHAATAKVPEVLLLSEMRKAPLQEAILEALVSHFAERSDPSVVHCQGMAATAVSIVKAFVRVCKPKIGATRMLRILRNNGHLPEVVFVSQNPDLIREAVGALAEASDEWLELLRKATFRALSGPACETATASSTPETPQTTPNAKCNTAPYATCDTALVFSTAVRARLLSSCDGGHGRLSFAGSGDGPPVSADAIDWGFLGVTDEMPAEYPSRVVPASTSGLPCADSPVWDTCEFLSEPVLFSGKVVVGFGRGSAQLGIPTANLDCQATSARLPLPGVYFGWASVRGAAVCTHEMVMSSGYNPYFDNAEVTVEPHIFHLEGDLLGAQVDLVVIGIVRAESSYVEFGHLVRSIQNDCEAALRLMASPRAQALRPAA
eukprot:Polyplicarium_translucidae@DN2388_c0_g1_i1.p1